MKKKIIISLSLLTIFILSFVTIILLVPNNKKLNLNCDLGVWCWNEEAAYKYLNFASENGADEIYYCSSKFDDDDKQFIKLANDKNIKVYFLAGEYDWIEDQSSLINILERYYEFYSRNQGVKFKGIHLDVEPHQFPDFKDKRQYYIEKYIQFANWIVSTYPDIKFDFDIPFWLEDFVLFVQQSSDSHGAKECN